MANISSPGLVTMFYARSPQQMCTQMNFSRRVLETQSAHSDVSYQKQKVDHQPLVVITLHLFEAVFGALAAVKSVSVPELIAAICRNGAAEDTRGSRQNDLPLSLSLSLCPFLFFFMSRHLSQLP